jgi:hypothetical protein
VIIEHKASTSTSNIQNEQNHATPNTTHDFVDFCNYRGNDFDCEFFDFRSSSQISDLSRNHPRGSEYTRTRVSSFGQLPSIKSAFAGQISITARANGPLDIK